MIYYITKGYSVDLRVHEVGSLNLSNIGVPHHLKYPIICEPIYAERLAAVVWWKLILNTCAFVEIMSCVWFAVSYSN